MIINEKLLRDKKVYEPQDFQFVTRVLNFLGSYNNLDRKAKLVGSAFTNYMVRQNQSPLLYHVKKLFNPNIGRYDDIDILVTWDIYSDKDANKCIDDFLLGKYPFAWNVEPSGSREFLSGYGGTEKILHRFKISSKASSEYKISTIDLIFEGVRELLMENLLANRRGNPLKPLK